MPETLVARKSSGILVAVTPCLQIVAARPMYSSESLVQVFLLVWDLLMLFGNLAYVIYDNACGAARSIRKRMKACQSTGLREAWAKLSSLHWVVDRLHVRYHTACRCPGSAWFVSGVDPADHPALLGVDTEAAEQVFHIASRWQMMLSYAAPTHQDPWLSDVRTISIIMFSESGDLSHLSFRCN